MEIGFNFFKQCINWLIQKVIEFLKDNDIINDIKLIFYDLNE